MASQNVKATKVSDLRKYSVGAFQNARLYLGSDFAAMAGSNPEYHEVWPQISLNRLLFSGRIQLIISDWNIFNALNAQIAAPIDATQAVSVHRLFPPTRYALNFTNSAYRDAFNESLKKVFAADPFPALAKRYLPAGSEITFKP